MRIFRRLIKLIKGLFKQLKDPVNILIYIIVLAVFFCPVWLAPIIRSTAFTGFAVSYLAFWAGPFTPAIPIQLAITFGIRKIIDKYRVKTLPLYKTAKKLF